MARLPRNDPAGVNDYRKHLSLSPHAKLFLGISGSYRVERLCSVSKAPGVMVVSALS